MSFIHILSILVALIVFLTFSVSADPIDIDDVLNYSIQQFTQLSSSLDGKLGFISTGNPLETEWNYTELQAWTVGFYGGSLWVLYKLTNDVYWKNLVLEYQERVKPRQFDSGTHDVGFVIMSTYGLAIEYGGMDNDTVAEYEEVIHQAARSLSSRFHPVVGCIRSWDRVNDKLLVIIDNMMNLELLFRAYEITGNVTFAQIAMSHANRTIEEHFREDWGIFHVVAYDEETGAAVYKYNHQGYSDDSTWSRGLAWAIHGYSTTFLKTGIPTYLQVAENAANYFLERLPEDNVPFWDFDAPLDNGRYQPRDTSAGAIAAHAFLQLFGITENAKYFDFAEAVLNGLGSYRADSKDEYQIPAILVNGTVHMYENNFNTAITYGDFYFLRAFDLYREIIGKKV